ncbi:hypothetical protein ACFY0Z_30065 [Streptomyces kronopolitis]|uniref:hypothetical protein n=1 Tax=Streptomyces kronopolitis TaxID=1612435 RepID=UPI00368B9BF7
MSMLRRAVSLSALAFEPGQVVFRPRDTRRTPLTVRDTVWSAGAHRSVQLLGPAGRSAEDPHHLVQRAEELRPNDEQVASSHQAIVTAVRQHDSECRLCQRSPQFWSRARRCVIGKRLINDLSALHYYRDNVMPWLIGRHVDPRQLRAGQRVVVRTADGGEFAGVCSAPMSGGTHVPSSTHVIVRRSEGSAPMAYPARTVFHAP